MTAPAAVVIASRRAIQVPSARSERRTEGASLRHRVEIPPAERPGALVLGAPPGGLLVHRVLFYEHTGAMSDDAGFAYLPSSPRS
jgi:hypothetical protein